MTLFFFMNRAVLHTPGRRRATGQDLQQDAHGEVLFWRESVKIPRKLRKGASTVVAAQFDLGAMQIFQSSIKLN
jgi:hypothetical protein